MMEQWAGINNPRDEIGSLTYHTYQSSREEFSTAQLLRRWYLRGCTTCAQGAGKIASCVVLVLCCVSQAQWSPSNEYTHHLPWDSFITKSVLVLLRCLNCLPYITTSTVVEVYARSMVVRNGLRWPCRSCTRFVSSPAAKPNPDPTILSPKPHPHHFLRCPSSTFDACLSHTPFAPPAGVPSWYGNVFSLSCFP